MWKWTFRNFINMIDIKYSCNMQIIVIRDIIFRKEYHKVQFCVQLRSLHIYIWLYLRILIPSGNCLYCEDGDRNSPISACSCIYLMVFREHWNFVQSCTLQASFLIPFLNSVPNLKRISRGLAYSICDWNFRIHPYYCAVQCLCTVPVYYV